MKSAFDTDPRVRRALAVLTGAVTWGLITAPFWASAIMPDQWVYLFVAFSLYWLYRSSSLAAHALVAYRRMLAAQRRDWLAACQSDARWRSVHHLVVFPTHREPVGLLGESLRYLADQDFPRSQVSVVLAFEERDPDALEKARQLLARFNGTFANLWVTVHPDLPGEPPGKASNLAYAVPRARKLLLQGGRQDLEQVLVTVCDADSRLPAKYLSALTHTFLADPDGRFCLYQPALLFHANLARIPLYVRVIDGLYSVIQLGRLAASYKLVTQSTYSLALSACHAIGYWDPEVVPEDSHMFFKMFFQWGEKAKVRPIYLPVLADAAEGTTWWRTLVSHYRQARRWSWGVSDVPYVLAHALTHRDIPSLARLSRAGHYTKEHLLWPTHWFLLAGGLNLIPHLAPRIALLPSTQDLALLSSTAFAASTPFLLVLIWLDQRLRARSSHHAPIWQIGLDLVAWALLPVLGLALMVLPAVEAHTRLLLGRGLGYDVTEKRVAPQPEQPALPQVSHLADQRAA
ncbi:MAG: glycosyltransferase family 2 protein [Chloroflexi bacterium]|nr:glycosyltransferase family 2 protein [Chloroflexota bacterium]